MAEKKGEKKAKTEETEEIEKEATETEEVSEENDIDALSEEEAKERLKKAESENAELRKNLEKAEKAAEDSKNDYLRARADCENVRKRKSEEVRAAYDDGRTDIITKILPIGDSLDWALKMPLDDKTREGIEKLLKKYGDILENAGVKEFSPEEGSAFDPNSAQAVMQVDGEEGDESGTVKQVFGRGYKLGERVVRYAQVSVVR